MNNPERNSKVVGERATGTTTTDIRCSNMVSTKCRKILCNGAGKVLWDINFCPTPELTVLALYLGRQCLRNHLGNHEVGWGGLPGPA